MRNFELETLAPPETARILEMPTCRQLFERLARRAVTAAYMDNGTEHMIMWPNRVAVMPFINDESVQFMLESSVDLPGGVRTQVQRNSISKVIIEKDKSADCLIIDNDSGDQLGSLKRQEMVAWGRAALFYTVESADKIPE